MINFDFNADDLSKKIIQESLQKIKNIASTVRCPEHGEYPKNLRIDSNNEVRFDACCVKLQEAVERKLS